MKKINKKYRKLNCEEEIQFMDNINDLLDCPDKSKVDPSDLEILSQELSKFMNCDAKDLKMILSDPSTTCCITLNFNDEDVVTFNIKDGEIVDKSIVDNKSKDAYKQTMSDFDFFENFLSNII